MATVRPIIASPAHKPTFLVSYEDMSPLDDCSCLLEQAEGLLALVQERHDPDGERLPGNTVSALYGQAQDSAIQTGDALQNQLFGQGVTANQAGMANAEAAGNFANTAQNQGFTQAATNAGLSNSAEAQGFNQSQANATLANQARAQGLQEQSTLATLPLNELNALRSGTQIQNPTFTAAPTATAAGTDISGDIYRSAQLNAANQNNFMNGLFGLGSAAIMA